MIKLLQKKWDRMVRKSSVYQKLLKESGFCVAENIRMKKELERVASIIEAARITKCGKGGNNG